MAFRKLIFFPHHWIKGKRVWFRHQSKEFLKLLFPYKMKVSKRDRIEPMKPSKAWPQWCQEPCLCSYRCHGAPAEQEHGPSKSQLHRNPDRSLPLTFQLKLFQMSLKKVLSFLDHLTSIFKIVTDMLLSKILLRKLRRGIKDTLLSLRAPRSLSWEVRLSTNWTRTTGPWMDALFPTWPYMTGHIYTFPNTDPFLLKSSPGPMSLMVVCYTFKALHSHTVYFFVSCNQFLNSVVFYFFLSKYGSPGVVNDIRLL